MYSKKIQLLLLGLVFALLPGCAAIEKQAFNRSANKSIRSVTIIEPTPAEGFGVVILNHPALNFGLIGATIYATEMKTKSDSFDAVMKPLGWSLTEDLVKQLAAQLTAEGFDVKVARIPRDSKGLIKDYKAFKSDGKWKDLLATDAWLDVSTRDPLYVANGPTADYLPSIGLTVRLVTANDQSVLYREDFFYGFSFAAPRLEAVVIPAESKYRFTNTDHLRQAPATTLDGVREGVPLLVGRIAQDLRHEGLKPPARAIIGSTSTQK